MRLIVDTDCGTDDLLAITFLAAHPAIELEAITTVHGLASAERGASNMARVLKRLGLSHVPVYVGNEVPLGEVRRFPADWIEQTESLQNVQLPITSVAIASESADSFLLRRFIEDTDLAILALGPLTNIAKALEATKSLPRASRIDILAMGGAVDVPGNLDGGGEFQTENTYAEWNFFIDPKAAEAVFASSANVRLVPLDATNLVPIRPSLLSTLRKMPQTEATVLALEILDGVANWIEEGHYFAWDPLAAVLISTPKLAETTSIRLRVDAAGQYSGRLIRDAGAREIAVHMSANSSMFEREFATVLRDQFSALKVNG